MQVNFISFKFVSFGSYTLTKLFSFLTMLLSQFVVTCWKSTKSLKRLSRKWVLILFFLNKKQSKVLRSGSKELWYDRNICFD